MTSILKIEGESNHQERLGPVLTLITLALASFLVALTPAGGLVSPATASPPPPITYTADTTLTSDVYCSSVTINSGVTVTTNGFNFFCTGDFANYGRILTGYAPNGGHQETSTCATGYPGGSVPSSYGGSGGGGASGDCPSGINGGNGGNTLAVGGQGQPAGGGDCSLCHGASVSPPTLTSTTIQSWYNSGFQSHLEGAGGGGASARVSFGMAGSGGGYGIYIQAQNIGNAQGNIIASGQPEFTRSLNQNCGGSGGGGVIILAYGSSVSTGSYSVAGGSETQTGNQCNGPQPGDLLEGGSGQLLLFQYGSTPPVQVVLSGPTIGSAKVLIDSGQSTTLSTSASFSGGISPYSCQWLQEAPGAGSFSDLGSSFAAGCDTSSLPSSSTGSLAIIGQWSFELEVTDSSTSVQTSTSNIANVTVNSALAPPIISASPSPIVSGQNSTLSTPTPFSGGTPPYSCQWLQEAPGAGTFNNLGTPFTAGCTASSNPSTSTGGLSALGTWNFELQVSDGTGSIITSSQVQVNVFGPSCTSPSISLQAPTIYSTGVTVPGSASSGGLGCSIASVSWIWGDGQSSISGFPSSHTYSSGGTYAITATAHQSDGKTNSSSLTVTVSPPKTKLSRTVVSCVPLYVNAGSPTSIKCKATVTGHAPTGMISWSQSGAGSVSFNSDTCNLSGGTCSVTLTGSLKGSVAVHASYVGDPNNSPSAGVRALRIGKALTTLTITCSSTNLSVGVPAACTVIVSSPYITPTGLVTWSKVAGTSHAVFSPITCTLVSGRCSVAITGTAVGGLRIAARYRGDINNLPCSGSLVLSVT